MTNEELLAAINRRFDEVERLTSGRPDRKEGIYFGEEHGPDHVGVRSGRPLHGANLFPEELLLVKEILFNCLELTPFLAGFRQLIRTHARPRRW